MRRGLIWLTGIAVLLLTVLSFLPLVESNRWFIRYLDFPRMQFAAALVLFWLIFALGGGLVRGAGRWMTLLAILALGYHGYRLWPYQPLAAQMVAQVDTCAADDRLSVIVANVRRENRNADKVLAMVREQQPDVLVVLETNDWWNEALAPLDADFDHRVQDIPSEATYFGMHLFSRLPLTETEVRFPFGADTPLIVTDLMHPGQRLRLFAVHPRPPQMFQPSTMRDATILEAALEAADDDAPAIIAGDFNAVPWERTGRRALRLAGLVDPRAGRGPMITFDAKSTWMKWPLDQILWQPGLSLAGISVLPGIGSDHYPLRADLCVDANAETRPIPPKDDDLAEAKTAIEAARRLSDATPSN